MTKSSLSLPVDQVSEILQGFIRLKPLLDEPPPGTFLRATRHLKALHSQVGLGHLELSGLYFRLGGILYGRQVPIPMGELGKELGVPLSTATRAVDWLVAHQLAERSPDPQDRRIVRVEMTQMGREAFQEFINLMAQRFEVVLGLLSPKEQRQCISLLRKIARGLANRQMP